MLVLPWQCSIFLAALEDGNAFARVERQGGVEGVLDIFKLVQLCGAELAFHLRKLFQANAVLSGNAASDRHRQLENLCAELFRSGDLFSAASIKHNQRMQVTVAGMENVGAAKLVLC